MIVHPLKFYRTLEKCIGILERDMAHLDMLIRRRISDPTFRSSYHSIKGSKGGLQIRIDTKSIFIFVQKVGSMEIIGRIDLSIIDVSTFDVRFNFIMDYDLLGQLLYCLLPVSGAELAALIMKMEVS